MIDLLKVSKHTFAQAELSDGDIICFQKELTPEEVAHLPDPTLASAPSYYDALVNRVTVIFKNKVRFKLMPIYDLIL